MTERSTAVVCRGIQLGSLVAAVAIVPLVFTTSLSEIFTLPKLVLTWVLTAVALGAFAARLSLGERPVVPSITPLVGGFVAVVALATVLGRAPMVSLFGLYGRYDGLLGLVTSVVFAALIVTATWDRPDRLRWLAVGLVAGATLAAAYVWLQRFDLDWREWFDSLGRPAQRPPGTLGNSNFSGAHLAMTLPLAMALAAPMRGQGRLVVLSLVAFLGAGVWFTGTRGGMLALLVGIAVTGWMCPRLLPRPATVVIGAVAAGASLLTVAAIVADTDWLGPLAELDVLRSESLEVRRQLWRAAGSAIGSHPAIGTGPDTFLVTYLEHRTAAGAAFPQPFVAEPHNIVLDHAVSAGLLGAGAYLAIVALVFRSAWSVRREQGHIASTSDGALLAGFTGMFAAYLTQGMVSVDTFGLSLLGWISVAAVVSISDRRVRARRMDGTGAREPGLARVPLPVTIGVIAMIAMATVFAIRPILADRAAHAAAERQGPAEAIAAVSDLERATNLMSTEPEYHARLARRLIAAGGVAAPADRFSLLDQAEMAADRALELFPDNVAYLQVASDVQVARGIAGDIEGFSRARSLLDEALDIDRHGWSTHERLGALAQAVASSSLDPQPVLGSARDSYLRSVSLNPDRRAPWVALRGLAISLGDDELRARAESELTRLDDSS